jgi:hypothetical protein
MLAVSLVSLVGLAGFGWPLMVDPGSGVAHAADAPYLNALLLPLVLGFLVALGLRTLPEGVRLKGAYAFVTILLSALTAGLGIYGALSGIGLF